MSIYRLVQASLACAIASMTSAGAGAGAQHVAFFEAKVLPVLKVRCFECHSHEKKMKGGLTLDSKSGWEQGGDSGPAIVVGKPEESLLIKMVCWTDEEQSRLTRRKNCRRRKSRCLRSG